MPRFANFCERSVYIEPVMSGIPSICRIDICLVISPAPYTAK